MKKKQKTKLIIGIVLIGGFLGCMGVSRAISNTGYSRTAKFTVLNYDGTPINTKVYYPNGFAESNSYPAIVVSHGDSSQMGLMHYYCYEFVKRGWIVVAYDFVGMGHSGNNHQSSEWRVNNTEAVFDFVKGLSFVNDSQIALVGHSRGGLTSLDLSDERGDEISATVAICSPMWNVDNMNLTNPRNLLLIAGSRDTNVRVSTVRWVMWNATENSTMTDGVLFGDMAAGTARKLHITDATHSGVLFSEDVINQTVNWLEETFYGSLRYPLSIDFKFQLYMLIATASIGIIMFFWSFGVVKMVLRSKGILVEKINGTDTKGMERKEKWSLLVKRKKKPRDIVFPFILMGAGGAVGAAGYFLYDITISYFPLFGFIENIPASWEIWYMYVILLMQLVMLPLTLLFWFLLRKQEKREERVNSYKLVRKGGVGLSSLIGLGFSFLFIGIVWLAAYPFFDITPSIHRWPTLLILVAFLVPASIPNIILTHELVQSRIMPRGGKKIMATLFISLLIRGPIIGVFLVMGYSSYRLLIGLIVFYALPAIFSNVSYHYFRSTTQEVVFQSFLVAIILCSFSIFYYF